MKILTQNGAVRSRAIYKQWYLLRWKSKNKRAARLAIYNLSYRFMYYMPRHDPKYMGAVLNIVGEKKLKHINLWRLSISNITRVQIARRAYGVGF